MVANSSSSSYRSRNTSGDLARYLEGRERVLGGRKRHEQQHRDYEARLRVLERSNALLWDLVLDGDASVIGGGV